MKKIRSPGRIVRRIALLAAFAVLPAGCFEELEIKSHPGLTATVGVQYRYHLRVDGGTHPLDLSLPMHPHRMKILESDRLIVWTPQASDVGSHIVKVRVRDAWGFSDDQLYILDVN